jgi:hypothetical protein
MDDDRPENISNCFADDAVELTDLISIGYPDLTGLSRDSAREKLREIPPADRVIDDIITYMQDDYFPQAQNGLPGTENTPARPATITPRVDYEFLQAQEQIQDGHFNIRESSVRYLCYKNGWDMFKELYQKEIMHCTSLYKEKSRSPDVELYGSMRSRKPIPQNDGRVPAETGFTHGDKEAIMQLAKVLGVTPPSMLVVFFWLSAGNSTSVEQHLLEYSAKMRNRFELHLKQRVHQLGFKRDQ